MNYTASISDFFKSPKWGMNMLLGGWHVTGFWAQKDRDPAKYPDFNFDHFIKYLERGLWPFLVSLVVSLVVMPFMMILAFATMGGIMTTVANSPNQEPSGPVFAGIIITFFVGYFLLIFVVTIVQMPLKLRAAITQDFAASFNWAFYKQFFALMWKDMLNAALFSFMAGLVLLLAGLVACYFGIFLTMPIAFFSWHHLEKQLYELYLARGGEAVPLSAKLQDSPPPLPSV